LGGKQIFGREETSAIELDLATKARTYGQKFHPASVTHSHPQVIAV
jgi:hypothetical protein